MIHQGHRARLKKRFLQEGLTAFEPHEVLELLLYYTIAQKDVNPIAHRLLAKFGSLEGVFSASKSALMSVEGIGEQSALFLLVFLPLFEYYQQSRFGEKPNLSTRKALFDFCLSLLEHKKEEVFYVLSLDGQMRLLQATPLSKGSATQVTLTTRTVVEIALHTGASTLVLCHNHPGGTAVPSKEDIESTNKIAAALEAIDIPLADHVIVASNQAIGLMNH